VAAAIACVVAAGGATAWFLLGSDKKSGTCEDLLKDKRVHRALGNSYKAGMSCSELGDAVKRATRGAEPGRHSLRQAQAMKTVLVAVGESLQKTGGRMDTALRAPLAESLADYAADTASILHTTFSEGPAYIDNGLYFKPAWKDDDGVHMAVTPPALLRVVRALSDDPAAYVTLRVASTQHAAGVLTAVPRGTTGLGIELPPAHNSFVFGFFDAVASDVRRGLGEERAAEWDRNVFEKVTARAPVPPSYTKDPIGHLVGSWRQTLRKGGLENSADAVEQQSADMVDTWSKAMGFSDKVHESLHMDAQKIETSACMGKLHTLSNLSAYS